MEIMLCKQQITGVNRARVIDSFLLLAGVKAWSFSTTIEVHLLSFWEAELLTQAPAPAEECKERRASYACHGRRPPFEYLRTSFQDWFDVRGERLTRINLNFKLSNSPLSICFSDLTAFAKITEPVNPIPQVKSCFTARLRKHQHIFQVTLSNSAYNLTLFIILNVHLLSADIIGELTAIRGAVDDSS
ncbi:unnamed protein product, partial [Brassica rapa subsp. trilocularis]